MQTQYTQDAYGDPKKEGPRGGRNWPYLYDLRKFNPTQKNVGATILQTQYRQDAYGDPPKRGSLRRTKLAVPILTSQIESKTKKMLEPPFCRLAIDRTHPRCQKKRVPDEGEIGRTYTIDDFLHALQAFSMSAWLRHAVSAAGPLCTHGKDKPGLGP